MSQYAGARLVTQIVAGSSVLKIVHDVIRNNTNVVTTMDAFRVAAGSLVITSMLGDHVQKHVNDRFDTVVAWIENRKTDDDSNT
jgi:hypothetical protein